MNNIFTRIALLLLCLLTPAGLWAQQDVLTQHNNNLRTGWDDQETQLTIHNVVPATFGKLFIRSVDDEIYAQPLVVSGVSLGGGTHNIVIVATVNNTVYAFDADDTSRQSPYWERNLTPAGYRPPRYSDMTGACSGSYHDFDGNIGIVGTPVIDTGNQTLYLVCRLVSTDGSNSYAQYLHAIDYADGQDRVPPVLISAQVSGSGGSHGLVSFDPQKNNQRPGLLLSDGIVYIGYASHCDWGPYQGWLLGYDENTLSSKYVYCTTPDGDEGGIWMSGSGPSADSLGHIYLGVGNGTVNTTNGPLSYRNRAESLVQLEPSGDSLELLSFFTPDNWSQLDGSDLDFGVTESLLIPGTDLVLAGCKNDSLYLTYRDQMGGFHSSYNQVIQQFGIGKNGSLRSTFAFYQGQTADYIYTWSENTALKQIPFDPVADTLVTSDLLSSGVQGPTGNSGAMLAVSSDGSLDSTAILWAVFAASGDANHSTRPGILHAFAADNVGQELWNSNIDPSDSLGNYAKFNCPTVANGKVYMGTFSDQLVVYGLHPSTGNCNTVNIALHKSAYASSIETSNP